MSGQSGSEQDKLNFTFHVEFLPSSDQTSISVKIEQSYPYFQIGIVAIQQKIDNTYSSRAAQFDLKTV